MNNADGIQAEHSVNVRHKVGGGPPTYKEVRVLAEGGILKNGTHYDQGSRAVITAQAAEQFEAAGEVEITGAADIPETVKKELSNAKNT